MKSASLHHGYLIEGGAAAGKTYALAFVKKNLGSTPEQNPDFLIGEYETFGIDDARGLKERALLKTLGEEGQKVFIISFHFITKEAQNALLKLFEEPTSHTYFFLITPEASLLLPTLRSRLEIIRLEGEVDKKEALLFLKSSVDERSKMLERYKDSENESKKSEALALLSGLEIVLKEKGGVTTWGREIENIITLKKYLYDKAPSVKMIVEYASLTLPVIK